MTNTRITGRELLKLVLDDLGVEVPAQADKSDLVIAFKRYLIEGRKPGRRVLIVVDEAQNLPTETLEEVRLLTNLGQGEQQPVQIILVGQPELEATVEQPELAQLRQRIRVHYRLDPVVALGVDGLCAAPDGGRRLRARRRVHPRSHRPHLRATARACRGSSTPWPTTRCWLRSWQVGRGSRARMSRRPRCGP